MPDRHETRSRAFCDAVDALLEEYADVIAPKHDCGDDDCQGGPDCAGGRVEGTVPHGWVLIHEWASLDGDWFDWDIRKGMTLTSALGLVGATEAQMRSGFTG